MSVTSYPPQCLFCARFRLPLSKPPDYPERTCDAYPGGIPGPIWFGHVDHRLPVVGDQGLQWTPDGDVEFPEMALLRTRRERSAMPPADTRSPEEIAIAALKECFDTVPVKDHP